MKISEAQDILYRFTTSFAGRVRPLMGLFEEQRSFIKDPKRLKSARCTRRAGKSYCAASYLVSEANSAPDMNVLYVGLTRTTAKNVIWPIIRRVADKCGLHYDMNRTELTFTFENGSKIFVTGADADQDEMEKLLGMPYKLVIIDEAQSYSIDLRRLVYEVLKPTTTDLLGTIALIGTPGDVSAGLFFDITEAGEPGWSNHRWSANDNPFMRAQWAQEIAEIEEINPLIKETPGFKRNYLNKWVVDEDSLVYKWTRSRNLIRDLPGDRSHFIYILGVDLGHNDATAFTLNGYSEHARTLYEIESKKFKGLDFTQVAQIIRKYENNHKMPVSQVIIDGANKQGVEEMRRRHGLDLTAADKHDKNTFIMLMNDDFIQGNIKTLESGCAPLIEEREKLVKKWNDFKTKWIEEPRLENHCTDSALYNWRYCYTYLSQAPVKKPKANTDEFMDNYWAEEAKQLKQKEELEKWMME